MSNTNHRASKKLGKKLHGIIDPRIGKYKDQTFFDEKAADAKAYIERIDLIKQLKKLK